MLMCQETFELVKGMNLKKIDTQLALQCAPLITGIKIANLLIVQDANERLVRMVLQRSGISFYRLLQYKHKTTFLLFRRQQLESYLAQREVQSVLKQQGYEDFTMGNLLRTFSMRYQECRKNGEEFPHEMGIFLGYPVEDVTGFIEQKGQNFLYSGYWKVYQDVEQKQALFQKYELAKDLLIKLVSDGTDIREIIDYYNKKELHIAG